MKKIISLILVALLMLSHFTYVAPLTAWALDVGDGATVTNVKFIKQHVGYDVTGGNVILIGSNLTGINVLFEIEGGIPTALGTLHADSNDFFLNYVLDFDEADSFTGKIYIGNKIINLNTPNFPNITSSSTAIVNQDEAEEIVISGSNLDRINDTTITGTFGRGIQQYNIRDYLSGIGQTASDVAFSPTAPGALGYQDITLTQTAAGDPNIEVTYYYQNAFRILENLDIAPVSMYPNAASKGDIITLSSTKFSDARNYQVYFLNTTDNDFAFSEDKRSPSVSLSSDKQRMSVQIPNNTQIALGTKRVVVVDVVNNEIVARYDLTEGFNLLDAVFKPTITKINPKTGTDEGANIQIIGRNLITPNIPELVSGSGSIGITSATPSAANRVMNIDFDETNLTFKGVPVDTLSRTIKAIISKQAFFELTGTGTVKYAKIGADDYLYTISDIIDDAQADPFKDVIVELDTEIVDENGLVFTFSQSVTVLDGFEFIPSSIEPIINSVTPDKVQINPAFSPKENTLLSIEGDDFLVNKYTDSSGIIHTNYPVVLIQVTDTLGDGDYVVKFDKNDTSGSPNGTIYDKDGIVPGVSVDMVILDSNKNIIDGSVGNEIGQRINVYLPREVTLPSGGKKNIQVINPKRNSNDLGDGYVVLDIIDFVLATDTPVIESVVPSIVTADSREEIVITGSNFQDGVKVYIDGIDVGEVVRAIDPQGNSMTLTFRAPVGRVTKTQVQVLNPLGGLAVRDFYYVQSFNQDPLINVVSPNKGTVDTLVVVSGDNYFKPDAAAATAEGLDGFRLLGTRVLLDGEDINTYNYNSFGEIEFIDYTSPDSTYNLVSNEAGRIKVSPFYVNTLITSQDDQVVYELTFDADGNPQIYDGNQIIYTLKYNEISGYQAFDNTGALVGAFTFNASSITINAASPVTFKVRLDNNLLRANYTINKKLTADLSDYWYAVILEDENTGDFFTLQKLADNSLRLTNGQFNVFTIKATGSSVDVPVFKAIDQSLNAYDVSINQTNLTVNTAQPIVLKMRTAFTYDSNDKRIVGSRVKVATKDKLEFVVPNIASSTGPKDVTVVNPDTKSDTKIDGFYYYHLPATQPSIASITPDRGSVSGGYIVTVIGKDFKETSQIYFDGILVPPANKSVNLAGTQMEVKVPTYPVDITEVFGVGELAVSVVIVNNDGGSAQLKDGFTYVKPASTPKISQVILNKGSTNGGEVVEIIGEDFRFFEPYVNLGGGSGYDTGIDTFTNINSKLATVVKWDHLLQKRYEGSVDLWEQTSMPGGANYYGYDYYYASPILPRVYFGTQLAKIVDFDVDYLKVIVPTNTEGVKDVIVMNNDAGVSNKMSYTFEASKPKVTYINPNQGARTGGELREIVGSGFADDSFMAYLNDDATQIVDSGNQVEALVRFGDLTNTSVPIGNANDGRINANRATVNIEGGLSVSYDGNAGGIDVKLEEGGVIYSRSFTNYDGSEVFIPTGMLKNDIYYYQPVGYNYTTPTVFNTATDYEWIRVKVDPISKRLFVGRGYAPKVDFETTGKLTLTTPAYYTVDPVTVYVFNPDGGVATIGFKFTNPASKPTIQSVSPFEPIPANSVENPTGTEQRMVQASISGGIDIEIRGHDFRDGVKVYLGTKAAQVLDITYDEVNDLEVIIAKVPAGSATDINVKLPIIIENTDGGIANTTDVNKLGTDKRLIYFIYRKPLSLPVIKGLVPNRTSQYGGNVVEIRGTDFRAGALVIIGSIGGVPVTPFAIEDVGRFIQFVVPANLTAGPKNIQVINTDFGTVTLNGALTVISYPTVADEIVSKDGSSPVSVVSTEGGQVIKLTGTNFQSGAKVVFGGQRILQIAGSTGEIGFYKDDKTYVIQGGVLAPKVEFVDENTLLVTTPEVFEEREYVLTVINPDTGLSDSNAKIRYSVPVPSAPTSLKVEVVNDQYIKLFNYHVDNVKYYELYTYLGRKSRTQLTSNDYRDFNSLGTTTLEPYKITRLDGFYDLVSPDKIYFVVKAVNEYGSSAWSNIVYLEYAQYEKIVTLGDPDNDGGLLPGLKEIATSEMLGSDLTILFTDERFSSNIQVDLTSDAFKDMKKIKIIMPDAMIQSNYSRMTLGSELLDLSYVPYGFNNDQFKLNNTISKEYVTWSTDLQQNSSTSSAISQLPRTVKTVSPVVSIDFTIANNTGTRNLGNLIIPIDVRFNIASQQVSVKASSYTVYHYDTNARKWSIVNSSIDRSTNEVKIQVMSSGYYVLTVNN
ncbi:MULTISPECIES: IPT/TIG domain-containing protein [unclassified Fusibacter]|uniref:IPT/TIG domain-containing protein n=1 Tax=unclassified Fusibacter TaxID=2624464 RepID=UPI001013622A|nr:MULTISPECIES: IPT/TIG domain-containing protein [unclassified Fusibacter]MCK8059325.1 IPT/TIG domain-containing protein [Fusibacter sp. A2]NPE21211.1 hypothetical protein [Fusibacter sp. A1]RXV62479.1 hypothetical protein DWB64_05195 [Fusibacter sp. A1]